MTEQLARELINKSLCNVLAVDSESKKSVIDNRGPECYRIICGQEKPCEACPENGTLRKEIQVNERWVDLQCQSANWTDGRRIYLSHYIDITAEKNIEADIEKKRITDSETGAKNRIAFMEYMSVVSKARLAVLRINKYKYIVNVLSKEQVGHVLISLYKMLTALGEVYRIENDTFGVVLTLTEKSVIKRLNIIMDSFSKKEYYGLYANVACGLGERLEECLYALRASSMQGNTPVVYDEGLEKKRHRVNGMTRCLTECVEDGCKEFELYYQPIVDHKTGQINSAEGLVRFSHPNFGRVPPSEFIPLCEDSRLILPLGDWITEQGMEFCKKVNDNGKPDFKLQINMSSIQLEDMGIIGRIYDSIKKTCVNPTNIIFELTERVFVNRINYVRMVMQCIKDFGCLFALDDFGTGESSLTVLWELPFDIVKIDSSFVKDIKTDPALYIGLISDLAHKLGCKVCIEGVETRDMLTLAKKNGVDTVQGYYYYMPMTETEIGGMIFA